jgi:hypothetical protein
MEIPRNHQGQLHAWMRDHRAHGHANAPGWWEEQIACDETTAYAIHMDEYDTTVARDLRIGDVVRWNEYADLTVTEIENVGDGHHYVITFAGKLDKFTGIGIDGKVRAYPGRMFQVYRWQPDES